MKEEKTILDKKWQLLLRQMRQEYRSGKNLECMLDLTFTAFYFAGQFGGSIPISEGRVITKELIKLLSPEE